MTTAMCRVCGHHMPVTASVCTECGWATGWYAAGLWTVRAVTALVIPAALLYLGWSWNAYEREKSASDEYARAQSQVLATIADQLVQLTSNTVAVRDAAAAVQRGCFPRTATNPPVSCLSRYADGIEALDGVVTRISWQTDTLPVVSARTYWILNHVKDDYWRPCRNEEPFEACGYRQRLVRLVYGFGSPQEGLPALRSCDLAAAEGAPCTHAREVLGAKVTTSFEGDTNVYFCSVVDDVNATRRLALGWKPGRTANRDDRMQPLLDRLEANMESSQCRILLRRWGDAHPSAPGAPPADR